MLNYKLIMTLAKGLKTDRGFSFVFTFVNFIYPIFTAGIPFPFQFEVNV